jgi:hypothetical protein
MAATADITIFLQNVAIFFSGAATLLLPTAAFA